MIHTFKLSIITGGSSGIGLATARILAREGSDIILVARSEPRLKAALLILEEERQKLDQSFRFCPIDVSDPEGVRNRLIPLLEEGKPIDLLVNCAGTVVTDYFENIGLERFDRVMAVNLRGPWIMTKALLPRILAPGGRIVNVASMAGILGLFGYTAYGSSKWALVGFSDALRAELAGKGISVSVLCPPDTDTPQLAEENLTKPAETRAVSGNTKVMSPNRVARSLLSGAKRRKFIILPGMWNNVIYFLYRLAPGLVRRIMDSDAAKARKSNGKFAS
jgi:3-dehydrosphinganine reductase